MTFRTFLAQFVTLLIREKDRKTRDRRAELLGRTGGRTEDARSFLKGFQMDFRPYFFAYVPQNTPTIYAGNVSPMSVKKTKLQRSRHVALQTDRI